MGRNNADFEVGGARRTFYHGSPVELAVGQYITSPKERKKNLQYHPAEKNDSGKVYVTPHYDLAYAMSGPEVPTKGYVYEVEPVGNFEEDPDLTPAGLRSFAVDAARVTRVIKQGDKVTSFGDKEKEAYQSGADEPSTIKAPHYPNSFPGKCRVCGENVQANTGIAVKTGRQKPHARYDTYHKECLANGS